jgi:hypothetical protein
MKKEFDDEYCDYCLSFTHNFDTCPIECNFCKLDNRYVLARNCIYHRRSRLYCGLCGTMSHSTKNCRRLCRCCFRQKQIKFYYLCCKHCTKIDRCIYCNIYGHTISNCIYIKNSVCSMCGEKGHFIGNCHMRCNCSKSFVSLHTKVKCRDKLIHTKYFGNATCDILNCNTIADSVVLLSHSSIEKILPTKGIYSYYHLCGYHYREANRML